MGHWCFYGFGQENPHADTLKAARAAYMRKVTKMC